MNLFTYGTLMVPEIMYHVAGCTLQSVEVSLEGYVRYGVKGEQYPGVTARAASRVDGILYLDVGSEALRRLDIFEGKMYSRQSVRVVRKTDQQELEAMVYVFKPEYESLLTGEEWDLQRFLQNGREVFEQEYAGFEELQNGEELKDTRVEYAR